MLITFRFSDSLAGDACDNGHDDFPEHDSDRGHLLCSGNRLGSDGATALSAPLERLTGLQTLNLRFRVKKKEEARELRMRERGEVRG